jgi:hypothetical protein
MVEGASSFFYLSLVDFSEERGNLYGFIHLPIALP